MRWAEFEVAAPRLAAVGREKLVGPGVVLVGTIRRDGSARISPVEPFLLDDELWLSMLPDSVKARDLSRDPRIVLNGIITSPAPDAELKVRGSARLEASPQVHQDYAAAAAAALGWQPVVGQFTLFAVDIDDVTYIGSDPETGAQHVARWPPGTEFLRAKITPGRQSVKIETHLSQPELTRLAREGKLPATLASVPAGFRLLHKAGGGIAAPVHVVETAPPPGSGVSPLTVR